MERSTPVEQPARQETVLRGKSLPARIQRGFQGLVAGTMLAVAGAPVKAAADLAISDEGVTLLRGRTIIGKDCDGNGKVLAGGTLKIHTGDFKAVQTCTTNSVEAADAYRTYLATVKPVADASTNIVWQAQPSLVLNVTNVCRTVIEEQCPPPPVINVYNTVQGGYAPARSGGVVFMGGGGSRGITPLAPRIMPPVVQSHPVRSAGVSRAPTYRAPAAAKCPPPKKVCPPSKPNPPKPYCPPGRGSSRSR